MWRHCGKCDGWFIWEHTHISGLILDILETYAYDPKAWMSPAELVTEVTDRRPGMKPDSIMRSIRVIRSRGGGLAADRETVETADGKKTVRRRWVDVESTTQESVLLLRAAR